MLGKYKLFTDFGLKLSIGDKIILGFLLFGVFSCLLANYSLYHITHSDVYVPFIGIILLYTCGQSLIERGSKTYTGLLLGASLFVYVIVTLLFHGEKPSVSVVLELIFGISLLKMKKHYQAWIFDRFINILAFLLAASIFEFILACYFGVSYIQSTPIYRNEGDDYYFYQGIINIFPFYYSTGICRFQAFTEEPGLVGTMCAFIIAVLNTKIYKWQFFVFALSGFLSMSLAFFIMFGLWVIYKSLNVKNAKNNLIIYLLIFLMFSIFSVAFNESISERINGKTSFSAIDNRGTETFKKSFDEYVTSSDVFFGRGVRTFHSTFSSDDSGQGNAGVKPFIYSYGMISMIFIFIVISVTFIRINGKSKDTYFFLLLFWLSFYQRSNWTAPYYIIVMFLYSHIETYYNSFISKNNE